MGNCTSEDAVVEDPELRLRLLHHTMDMVRDGLIQQSKANRINDHPTAENFWSVSRTLRRGFDRLDPLMKKVTDNLNKDLNVARKAADKMLKVLERMKATFLEQPLRTFVDACNNGDVDGAQTCLDDQIRPTYEQAQRSVNIFIDQIGHDIERALGFDVV